MLFKILQGGLNMATKKKTVANETPNKISLLNLESEEKTMADTEVKLERLNNMAKVNFLNTTPTGTSKTWSILGKGITSKENSYGAKTTDEHWIVEDNERHSVDGYALGSDIEQIALKGDPVFTYIDDLMFKMKKGTDLETELLEVFKYRVTETDSTPKYDARLFKCLIVPDTDTLEGGTALKIKYKIQIQGDPTFGTVTFTSGVPTFAEATA
jgi:hypothetical protein